MMFGGAPVGRLFQFRKAESIEGGVVRVDSLVTFNNNLD